jgi:hypothetical protein
VNCRLGRAGPAMLALLVLPLLLGACGGGSSSSPSARHTMSDGTVMSGKTMGDSSSADPMSSDRRHGARAPSETASMICGEEIRGAVRRNLDLTKNPVGLHAWHRRLFSCTYQLGGGELRLSVKDLDQPAPGQAYYEGLRKRLHGATAIRGLANFGFPAFETPQGDVVFIKDHKTLWVDATRLGAADLPKGATRQDVAYGVASAVIGCWTE